MNPITPVVLVPAIVWVSTWPIHAPTVDQAAVLAILAIHAYEDIKNLVVWLVSKKA